MNDCTETASSGLLPLLLRAGTAVAEELERSLEPWSLSLAKLRALEQLDAAPEGLPLGHLAERLCCVKSNVTQLVDRLESDGFVRRVPQPADRRCVVATITERGRASFRSASAARERAEREVLGRLSDGDRERLETLLARLAMDEGTAIARAPEPVVEPVPVEACGRQPDLLKGEPPTPLVAAEQG
jgi:DNA-binding MarR family transcriptional regulator